MNLADAMRFVATASCSVMAALLWISAAVFAEGEPDEWRIFRADSDSRISALAMNVDGSLLAVGGDHGEILVVNAGDGSIRQQFQASDDQRINAAAFLADDRIAVGGDDGQIKVWRLTEEPAVEFRAAHPPWVTSLAISPDRNYLVSSASNRNIRLWELATTSPDPVELTGHSSGVKQVAFSTDGTRLISSGDRVAIVWNFATREPLSKLTSNGVVRAARFTPDGRIAITASEDGAARTFDVETGNRKRSLTGHAGMVWSLDISPDGTRVATGGFDQTVRVWEIESGRRQRIFRGPTTPIIGVQWSRDGTSLFVAGEEQILRRYPIPMESAP